MSQVSLMPSPFGVNVFGITGDCNTDTVTCPEAEHPLLLVTVSVYMMSEEGEATGSNIVVLLKLVTGDHR